MAKNNGNLINANKRKNDEFYTLYKNIEEELQHYIPEFKNKVIYCNTDDYNKSNFYLYFFNNFQILKLKKLITTSYNNEGQRNIFNV